MKQVTYNTFVGFINTQSQIKLVTTKKDGEILRTYFDRSGCIVATWFRDNFGNDICEIIN